MTANPKYDHDIVTNEIIPPIGRIYRWESKARVFEIGKGEIDAGLHVYHGETKEEAETKVRQELDQWLKNHPNN